MSTVTTVDQNAKADIRIKKHDYIFLPLVKILPDWVTPNHLSALRLCMFLPLILLMLLHFYKTVAVLFLFAAILDGVDGSMARYRNQETKLGAILDPTADKVVNFVVFLGFLFYIKSNIYLGLILAIVIIDSCLFGVAIFKFVIKDVIPVLDKNQDIFDHTMIKNFKVTQTGANKFGKTKMVLQVIVLSFLLLFDPTTSLKLHQLLVIPWDITLLHISYPILIACVIFGGLSLYGHLKVVEFSK
ncbi:CDP-alcohol phosphatidyltransferase family protein [Patescibacteria group bacterium]